MKAMDNKQLYNFTREQTQVFLTSKLGDGCICTSNGGSYYYSSNCIHKEYLEFKKDLVGKGKITYLTHNGYSQKPIYTYYGGAWPTLKCIKEMSLSEVLNNLDDLGLALWFYDDGSLHQKDLNYFLHTEKFSKKEHEEIIIPYFESIGLHARLHCNKNHKSLLYFLGFTKYDGAREVSGIMERYPIGCYSYKMWSSETIQKWSKLQEKLKSTGKVLTNGQMGYIWRELCKI